MVTQFLLRTGLAKKNRLLWFIFSPLQEARGIFGFVFFVLSDIYCEDLVENPEVSLTKLWRHPHDRVPGVFCIELPAIHQLQCRFPYLGAGSRGGFYVHASAL